MPENAQPVPGRTGERSGYAVSNARRPEVGRRFGPSRSTEWGVRFGHRYCPDYAEPDPALWNGAHGGSFLTPDDADALADHLKRSAAWARAQNTLVNGEAERHAA